MENSKKRIIVAGSRTANKEKVFSILSKFFIKSDFRSKIDYVITGSAAGVDKFCEIYSIPNKRFPVTKKDWETLGKKAGPIRNSIMASEGDILLAIWDGKSKGIQNMISEMKKLKKKFFVVEC